MPGVGDAAWWLLVAGALLALAVVGWDGLAHTWSGWRREEYSHGYLIPIVTALMIWSSGKLQASTESRALPAVLLAASAIAALMGELGTIYAVIQYAVYGMLVALFWAVFGWQPFRRSWPAWCFLVFAIPLPSFVYFNLSQDLQLLSSSLGVAFIRLLGISVFLEGNVIDLGAYQLQVVEACSGLRYLFPLMSFGFLVAWLYRGPAWQKVVIFLSAMPIAILMNSIRIGVVGVLVEHQGLEAADGFMHYFEGWVIFVACLLLLWVVMWMLARLSGHRGALIAIPELPPFNLHFSGSGRHFAQVAVGVAIVACCAGVALFVGEREETRPQRVTLNAFPLFHEGWVGRERSFDVRVIDALALTDYVTADYTNQKYGLPVNLYVAYYGSQRKGASVHSPRACIPGGGWVIEQIAPTEVDLYPTASNEPLQVQRVLISKGNVRQLVYYWFEQRGRRLSNQYAVKWYLFWDSLTRNRSDGALVRLVIPLPADASLSEADEQMVHFMRDFEPLWPRYLPK